MLLPIALPAGSEISQSTLHGNTVPTVSRCASLYTGHCPFWPFASHCSFLAHPHCDCFIQRPAVTTLTLATTSQNCIPSSLLYSQHSRHSRKSRHSRHSRSQSTFVGHTTSSSRASPDPSSAPPSTFVIPTTRHSYTSPNVRSPTKSRSSRPLRPPFSRPSFANSPSVRRDKAPAAMGFGDFQSICEKAPLPLCSLLGKPSISGTLGLQSECYSRSVLLANTLIFQGANDFIHILALIMTSIMIIHVRSKFTAVGKLCP